ncbi:MGT family glycosyltransferase [Streptomyces kunmingensis]|uniref:MGT family glycosyltransferase n=1 Tax=Streptomyces kunmingensis TaxID=68225 RepID=A0ABU6C4G4_9ACTN|nr:macrolide family glycosyltransferase [Streptomyces kunmingensis]MEB3959091.1 MGT family glycosyltransferase [Streptomyces kunmingensis]
MTTKHVAIFVFPGYGHVNPTLEFSRLLTGLGHRVSYVLDERLAAPVRAAGAEVVGYPSRRGRLGAGTVTGEDIGALGLAFLRESVEEILPRTLRAFEEDVPDLILYDLESFFTARTAARNWGRPTAQLFPYVASNEHYSLAQEVFTGAGEHLGQCIALVAEQLAMAGEDPDGVWSFMANFDERNLVLLPRELQPLGETFDERYTFTGHSLPADRPRVGSWSRPAGDGPVALITLGTEVNDRPDFFETCGAAFADGDWHVVAAVGPGNLPAGPVAGHVELHEWLEFSTVLPHVSAVVCHSGMSTILESLSFGRPLVIVTYTPEDRVNSRRVAELGLGVELPGEEVTAERLRAAVESVANDPRIRRRAARMRMDMLAAGGPARAARLIDGWLDEPFPTSGEPMKHTALPAAAQSAGVR